MSKWLYRWLALWVVGCLAISAHGDQLKLTYNKISGGIAQNYSGYVGVQYLLQLPEGQWKLPEFICKQPVYAMLKLGEQERLMAFDYASESDDFYRRIYFDANANGDLTDDPVYDGKNRRNDDDYRRPDFQPIETTVKVGDKQLPYCFEPSIRCYQMHVLLLRRDCAGRQNPSGGAGRQQWQWSDRFDVLQTDECFTGQRVRIPPLSGG